MWRNLVVAEARLEKGTTTCSFPGVSPTKDQAAVVKKVFRKLAPGGVTLQAAKNMFQNEECACLSLGRKWRQWPQWHWLEAPRFYREINCLQIVCLQTFTTSLPSADYRFFFFQHSDPQNASDNSSQKGNPSFLTPAKVKGQWSKVKCQREKDRQRLQFFSWKTTFAQKVATIRRMLSWRSFRLGKLCNCELSRPRLSYRKPYKSIKCASAFLSFHWSCIDLTDFQCYANLYTICSFS